ncbi:MAG: MEDS domain-containing protein [Sedimentibacter sp.]
MCNKCILNSHNEFSEMINGDHTCLIYDRFEDYVTVATEFIKIGLNSNEMVFCVIDEYNEETLINDLKALDIDVEKFIENGQLVISSLKNTYRGTGEFNPDDTLEFWRSILEANKDCAGIRIMGEATFALDGKYKTLEKLIEYEIRVNIDLIPLYKNHQYLCVYNKHLYPSGVLKSIIRAHPNYINGTLYSKPNPFYLEPKNNLMVHREEVELYNEFQILDNSVYINLEKELRTDQERFRYILGSIGDGVWDYDIIKNTLYVSQDLLSDGDDEKKLVNNFQDFSKYIHPDDLKNFQVSIDLHSQNKSALIKEELRLKTKNGTWNWYECKGKTVGKSENGQNTRIVGTFQDIQMRKNIELEKQNINKILEQKVQERTVQLLNANKELESFSYSVSHDLRAPLRSIDGFSKALLLDYEENLDETALHYINRIRSSTVKMNQLINDLLNLSRLNRSTLKIELINLSKIVQAYSMQYKELNPERNIKFLIAPNIAAQCDKGLISIVFTNLLDNATKFTSKNIQSNIEFGVNFTDSKPIYFIKDDGAGFDMAYSEKLFGIFQRLHRQDEFEGNGIGLVTIQRIIHRHHGEIWAEGQVEKGATFYFTLQAEGGNYDI